MSKRTAEMGTAAAADGVDDLGALDDMGVSQSGTSGVGDPGDLDGGEHAYDAQGGLTSGGVITMSGNSEEWEARFAKPDAPPSPPRHRLSYWESGAAWEERSWPFPLPLPPLLLESAPLPSF